jgi:hypothetical protein
MIIDIKEKIIEIKSEEGSYLKDSDNNVFEGICFKNEGQTEEELKGLFFDITEDEYIEIIRELEEELEEEENLEEL